MEKKNLETSKDKILEYCKSIRPIIFKEGTPSYLRELREDEILYAGYYSHVAPEDFTEIVNFSELSLLADVKMLHNRKECFFEPKIIEIIGQIPKELLEKTMAFLMVYEPEDIRDKELFKEEFEAGYQVSVVRLYTKITEDNEKAKELEEYPEDDDEIPIGMSAEKFEALKVRMKRKY